MKIVLSTWYLLAEVSGLKKSISYFLLWIFCCKYFMLNLLEFGCVKIIIQNIQCQQLHNCHTVARFSIYFRRTSSVQHFTIIDVQQIIFLNHFNIYISFRALNLRPVQRCAHTKSSKRIIMQYIHLILQYYYMLHNIIP